MKTMVKCIVGFVVAFILLFPLTMVIGTVFDSVNEAADLYTNTGDAYNVSSNTNTTLTSFQTSFIVVYAIWGGSFLVMLIASYKKDQQQEIYNEYY